MTLTPEDLQAFSQLIDQKLTPVLDEIASVKESITSVKEDTAITRSATNSLIEWADKVSVITQIKFPVNKAE